MAKKKQEDDVDYVLKEQEERKLFSSAFHTLLHRALTNWLNVYDVDRGVISVPINDWDRAQHPVLGSSTDLEIDINAFRLVGTDKRIPAGMLNRDGKKGGKR